MSDFVDQLREVAAASLFPRRGELTRAGSRRAGRRRPRRLGRPYLSAASLDDLWFAQGFVTAGERLFQLDLLLRAANGRLSEIFADRTLATTASLARSASTAPARALAAGWDDASTPMHARFREGVRRVDRRRCRRRRSNTRCSTCAPSSPRDEPARGRRRSSYLAWGLSGNWDKELLRARSRARGRRRRAQAPATAARRPAARAAGRRSAAALRRPPAHGRAGLQRLGRPGSRTATGKPLLANDPHLLASSPAPGSSCTCARRATGRGAWRSSSRPASCSGPPRTTPGASRTSPATAGSLRRAPRTRMAPPPSTTARGSRSRSARGDPRPRDAEPVVFEVRETRHGPILDTVVRGVRQPEYVPLPETPRTRCDGRALECGIRPSLVLDAAHADELRGVPPAPVGRGMPRARTSSTPTSTARSATLQRPFPRAAVRATGHTVPGWTDEHEWDGGSRSTSCRGRWIRRRYLVTANNRIHDDAYPHLIGHDFHAPYRARRIADGWSRVARTTSSPWRHPDGHGVARRRVTTCRPARARSAHRR